MPPARCARRLRGGRCFRALAARLFDRLDVRVSRHFGSLETALESGEASALDAKRCLKRFLLRANLSLKCLDRSLEACDSLAHVNLNLIGHCRSSVRAFAPCQRDTAIVPAEWEERKRAARKPPAVGPTCSSPATPGTAGALSLWHPCGERAGSIGR